MEGSICNCATETARIFPQIVISPEQVKLPVVAAATIEVTQYLQFKSEFVYGLCEVVRNNSNKIHLYRCLSVRACVK